MGEENQGSERHGFVIRHTSDQGSDGTVAPYHVCDFDEVCRVGKRRGGWAGWRLAIAIKTRANSTRCARSGNSCQSGLRGALHEGGDQRLSVDCDKLGERETAQTSMAGREGDV